MTFASKTALQLPCRYRRKIAAATLRPGCPYLPKGCERNYARCTVPVFLYLPTASAASMAARTFSGVIAPTSWWMASSGAQDFSATCSSLAAVAVLQAEVGKGRGQADFFTEGIHGVRFLPRCIREVKSGKKRQRSPFPHGKTHAFPSGR